MRYEPDRTGDSRGDAAPRRRVGCSAKNNSCCVIVRSLILVPHGQEIARRAGVSRPESVRLLAVPEIPLPAEADLRQAARQFDLITQDTAGLTIGHGIFVREQCLKDAKLVAHELMHVAQYERHGSILGFLARDLSECNEFGYPAAPMEQEAIAFAVSVFPQPQ